MKNILFSDPCRSDYGGGIGKWLVMMTKQLNQQGYSVHLVCRLHSLLAHAAQNSNITILQALFKHCLDIKTFSKIRPITRKKDIDIIICATNLDIKLAGLTMKITSIPVISGQGIALIPNKDIIKYSISSVITNTQSIKQQYKSYNLFPSEHIQVIYNRVILFSKNPIKDLRMQPLPILNEKFILSTGRLSKQKGFAYLIKTAQTKRKYWKFIVFGDGQEKESLQKLIIKKRLKNIQLLGFQNNMHDFYRNVPIFVSPSLTKGNTQYYIESHGYTLSCHCNGYKQSP